MRIGIAEKSHETRGSDKTQNGTERNGTNRGALQVEKPFLADFTPIPTIIQ